MAYEEKPMGHEVLLVSREGWVHAQHQISVTHLLPTTHSRCTMIWKWVCCVPEYDSQYGYNVPNPNRIWDKPLERALKTALENSVRLCVLFCSTL